MARVWLRLTSVAGVVALASMARADAPLDQYDLFDLTDLVIHDLRTGLYWQRYASTAPVTWSAAFDVCAAQSSGSTVWRVPSYKELLTIVDEVPHTEYENGQLVHKAIPANAFPGAAVTGAAYWTSSPYLLQPGYAYSVDFQTGVPQGENMGHSLYVRCVHE